MDLKRGTAEDVFVTETDAAGARKRALKSVVPVFFLFAAAAGLGFLISWQAFVFFELLVIVACLAFVIQTLRKNHHVELRFEGSRLKIRGFAMQGFEKPKDYEVYDVPKSDFIIRQTQAQAETDCCCLTVKNTVFFFTDVKKCRELQEYIDKHFPDIT